MDKEFCIRKLDEILTNIAIVNKELLKFKIDATNFLTASTEDKIKVGGLKAKKMAYEIQFEFLANLIGKEYLGEEHSKFLESVSYNIGSLVNVIDGEVVYNPSIEEFLKAK